MRRARRCFSFLVLLLTCGLTACALQPKVPLDFSFTGVQPALLPGQDYQLPAIAADKAGIAKLDGAAGALSLPAAWQLALEHNHAYQAAIKSRKAAATLRAQGRARLLPHIRAGYSFFHVTGQRQQLTPFGRTVSQSLDYNSKVFYVRLRQPLLDFGRYSDYQWYLARANKGQADWRVARYELAQRLVKKWVDTLAARAKLALQQELVDSLARQFEAQQALYEHGVGRITDVRQTRSRLKTARAQLVGYQAELRVARYALQTLVGVPVKQIKTLAAEPVIGALALRPLDEWQRRARANNARIEASRAAERVAAAAVDRYVKSQWPSLHLVAGWQHAESGDLSTVGQSSSTYFVGLQLTMPIFAGGQKSAKAAQSRAQRLQASYEVAGTIQRVQTKIARYYQNVRNAIERIQALRASVKAGKLALKATRIGYKYGTKDNLDVLEARDELFQSRADLAQARMNLLRSYILLRLTAGGDLASIFRQADALFFSASEKARSDADSRRVARTSRLAGKVGLPAM